MEKATWYFDLISPFAYLHYHKLGPLRTKFDIEPVPVLFAGLLKHWDNKGPAEIAPKRLHTYQYVVWAAGQMGLPFRMPPRHPFNPLAAQRLMVALGASDHNLSVAFDFIFGEGRDPEVDIDALGERLGVADVAAVTSVPAVKQQLTANTQQAIERGVFGVPSLVIRDRVFWGSDTVDWALQFADHPDLFEQPEYVEAARCEVGVVRRQVGGG